MAENADLLHLYLSAPGMIAGGDPAPTPLVPLLDTHQRALAASRSVIERMREGHVTITAELATEVLLAVVARVEAIEALLAMHEPDARFTRDLDAFAEQYIGKLFDNALRMLEATGQHVTAHAGEDIRDNGDDETVVDRFFGALVLPTLGRTLRPVKGTDGTTRYAVEDPSDFNR